MGGENEDVCRVLPMLNIESVRHNEDTYVTDDGQLSESFENLEPDSDILTFLGDRSTSLADKFVSIETDFEPVVEKSKQRGQGESSDEDCDEPELQHFTNEQ